MAKGLRNSFLSNHHVELVRGGKPYFNRMLEMIDSASQSINLQVYIFEADDTGKKIGDALAAAARRQVRVNVLIDGYASQGIPRDFVERLRHEGVYFKRFEPLFKSKEFYFGRRLHHKVLVIDGMSAMVGGINISDRYNDLPEKPAWLDWALYVEGSVAEALHRICLRRMGRHRIKLEKHVISQMRANKTDHNYLVRTRINDWVGGKRQIYNSYLEMFRHAESEIIIMSPYFLPGNEFRRKMRQSVKRGVRIKLILAGISDIFLSKHAERFVYGWLLKNNIEIYEYQQSVLHGKIAVCDAQWMTAGSFNINDLSAHASIELNLDVKSEEFAGDVKKRLEEIVKKDCTCITHEVYKKDSRIFSRLMQHFSYHLFRLVLFLFTFYFRRRE
jgi:cardiolipin synthase